MDIDQECKNLLCERTCDCCKNEEDDFVILNTKQFPFIIPNMHRLLLVERQVCDRVISIKAYLKDGKVLVGGGDFSSDSTYILHFRYPKCLITEDIIPTQKTCEQFQPIK